MVDAGREQCTSRQDCTNLGREFANSECVSSLCQLKADPSWACLGEEAAAASRPPNQVRMIVPLTNAISNQPTPGIEVRACERIDVDCLMPVAAGVSNDAGEADLLLPGGFDGYLRWEGPDIYPTLFFLGAAVMADGIFPVSVLTPQFFESLNEPFHDELVEDRSAIVVYVKDCTGTEGVGVSLSLPEGDDATRVFYMIDGLFPASQNETSAAGLAGVVNVPSGYISIAGVLSDGREIGTAVVLTRPGFATFVNLGPAR
jgi:hypothetical protein